MQHRPDHHRRSIRLKDYDYKQTGAYFVTICTQHRACLLGAVMGGQMQLNDAGQVVQRTWDQLPSRLSDIGVDAFIIMPNHLHGIILVGAQFIAPGASQYRAAAAPEGAINRAPTLGGIIRAFKGVSTRLIRQTSNPKFTWQRNYYEHVIRSEILKPHTSIYPR